MNRTGTAANPLVRVAELVPVKAAMILSVGGRILAAAVALAVAVDQTYDPTEVLAPAVAALLLLSVIPVRGRAGSWVAGAGGSLAFFVGAVLFNVAMGWLMVPLGIVAIAGVVLQAYHREENLTPVWLSLLAGPPLIAVMVATVVLFVEG